MIAKKLITAGVIYFFLSFAARAAPLYRVTDLGELPDGPTESRALDINDLGQVVGWARYHFPLDQRGRAFSWTTSTGMQDLGVGDPPFGSNSANAINNLAGIVGNMELNMGGDPPGSETHPFLWTNGGGVQDLAGIGDIISGGAHGINDSGKVVGGESFVCGFSACARAFSWESGVHEVLDPLPGEYSAAATDVNNNGQIVGWSSAFVFHTPNEHRAVTWTVDGVALLEPLPAGWGTEALAINNVGEIAGHSAYRAVIWSSDFEIQDLGELPGQFRAYANDINDAGQVVGTSWIGRFFGDERPFLWTSDGGMLNLNDLLDESGDDWFLREAAAINNRGQIVGFGNRDGYGMHAFLLTPIPEPATTALLTLGIVLTTVASRRRPRAIGGREVDGSGCD
jgi:probable HAF family extracellular repeat protein